MNESKGFIKLYRSVLEWEWFNDANTFRLFMYCLLKANYTDTTWRGIEIKRGSFISSYNKLSAYTGLTTQQVRTSLNKLIITGEVTHKSHSKYSVIEVNNYEQYQDANTVNNKKSNSQKTKKEQDNNKEVTTDKELKKEKKKEVKKRYLNNVYITVTEYQKLIDTYGERMTKEFIARLDEYISMKTVSYKSHYTVIQNWIRRDPNPKWQFEIQSEQEKIDNLVIEPKREKSEVKDLFDKL